MYSMAFRFMLNPPMSVFSSVDVEIIAGMSFDPLLFTNLLQSSYIVLTTQGSNDRLIGQEEEQSFCPEQERR